MSKSRNIPFDKLAEKFKALSNPHRLKIFMRLAQDCTGGSCSEDEMSACVGELGKNLKIAPSTVSHHIKELNRAGLITLKRNGKTIQCRIELSALAELEQLFKSPMTIS